MKKTILLLILLLAPLSFISAGTYGAGTFGVGTFNVGEVPVSPVSPGGGGGGTDTCTYDWDCTTWFPAACPESEMQERICANRGTCVGILSRPDQIRTCEYLGPTEPLFDIFLTIPQAYKKICSGSKIKAKINLENYGKIELLDAFMTYWIVDRNSTLIVEVKDTRAVKDRLSFNTEIDIPEFTPEGTYHLYSQINYASNKTAIAGESFQITEGTYCKLQSVAVKYILIIILSLAILIVTAILLTILIKKKIRSHKTKKGKEIIEEQTKIKPKKKKEKPKVVQKKKIPLKKEYKPTKQKQVKSIPITKGHEKKMYKKLLDKTVAAQKKKHK